jgi:hypothetical protein
VVNLISLIAAPVIVRVEGQSVPVIISTLVLGGLFVWAFRQSKKDVAVLAPSEA